MILHLFITLPNKNTLRSTTDGLINGYFIIEALHLIAYVQ